MLKLHRVPQQLSYAEACTLIYWLGGGRGGGGEGCLVRGLGRYRRGEVEIRSFR